jgi:Domain of unknown function (DUF4124)
VRYLPKIFLIAVLGSCPFGSALAEMYKCVENGKTTFQGTPCVGAGATVSVTPANGSSSSPQPSPASDKSQPPEQSSLAKTKDHVRSMELERRLRENAYEIENLESKIRGYQSGLDRDLAALRRKKAYAENNLAGATYEQSISTEMQSVSDRYKVNIQIAQDQMSQLRSEASELRKSH